ncbi:MAG: DMT family transporter [Oscillospiraceae bacterium]|nr:DMT family transporter [Oscillospiraceae bacterium]
MHTFKISEKNKGIVYIILAAFFFALMNTLVRLAGDLPSIQKSFFRNIVAMIFAFVMMKRNNISVIPEKKNLSRLICRASFGTIGIICNFYAIDHMLVADASMLNKLSPFFAIIFSFLLLKEKIKPVQITCLMIAFVGLLFIIKPSLSGFNAWTIVGIMGGMAAGAAYTFVRILSQRGEKGQYIVFFFSAFSCLVTLPVFIAGYRPMSAKQILVLVATGLAGAGGQFSVTAAYSHSPAREISIYDYTQIIFATILSFVLLGQVPDRFSFIGYFIICSASLIMFIYNNKKTSRT